MRSIGSLFFFIACVLSATPGQAAVTASVDRQNVALGDTLRLTITATENEEIGDTDLQPLLADFEILQRSTSSSTSIVNGRRSHSRQILLDITPRRQGALEIPPLRVGSARSNSLSVTVGPPATAVSPGETVRFEAAVDRDTVYVQGQVILTLRIQQAINLDNRGVSELKLEDAFVKQLEQASFQRNIDGRPWLVHEIRYAIFPVHSGSLEIPSQTFSARESRPRRSFFDLNSGGKLLRRTSEPLTIEVLPRPAEFTGETWLPARSLSIEENWSTPPEQLRAGESATRTITVRGEGLQGAQLPPVTFDAAEGLKYYPDQPVISDAEIGSGLLGSRQDSAALVPTRAGSWVIPGIRIPWWDSETETMRFAEIPERRIEVAAADPATISAASPVTVGSEAGRVALAGAATGHAAGDNRIWQLIASLSSAGWLVTLYLLWRGRARRHVARDPTADDPSEARAFKQLAAACAANNADQARQAIIQWSGALFPQKTVVSLDQAGAAFGDSALQTELTGLNRSLFSQPATPWDGSELGRIVRRLRSEHKSHKARGQAQLELYPA
jgi:hypothetical protein